MFIVTLKRILKSGWNNFWQDRSLLVSTLSIMVVVIFLVTGLLVSHKATQFLVTELQEKMDISVYFKSDTSEQEILEVQQKLDELPQIKEMEWVSKQEALTRFKQRHKDNPALMESLNIIGVNPFLASLNIKTFAQHQYQMVADFLNQHFPNLIDHTNYHQSKQVISKVFSISSAVNTGMLTLSFILAFIGVVVVFNTIRLSIVNRRKEISIMRLVGAKSWFIRGPFIIQGILIGISAAIITTLIFSLGLYLVSPGIQTLIPGLDLFAHFVSNFSTIFIIQILTGAGLTVISSLIATRKYLRI